MVRANTPLERAQFAMAAAGGNRLGLSRRDAIYGTSRLRRQVFFEEIDVELIIQ